jgi:hypothetical protein
MRPIWSRQPSIVQLLPIHATSPATGSTDLGGPEQPRSVDLPGTRAFGPADSARLPGNMTDLGGGSAAGNLGGSPGAQALSPRSLDGSGVLGRPASTSRPGGAEWPVVSRVVAARPAGGLSVPPPASDPGAVALASGLAERDGDGVRFRWADHPYDEGLPAVQRAPDPPPPAAPEAPSRPPPSTPPPTPAAAPAAAGPAPLTAGGLDELAGQLYDRIRDRLGDELRRDRERAGLATGLH